MEAIAHGGLAALQVVEHTAAHGEDVFEDPEGHFKVDSIQGANATVQHRKVDQPQVAVCR